MGRREALGGMTATGLAGPLNLVQLLSAQAAKPIAQVQGTNRNNLTCRERDDCAAPSRLCVEDTPTPED
jgi:hypothetical protein